VWYSMAPKPNRSARPSAEILPDLLAISEYRFYPARMLDSSQHRFVQTGALPVVPAPRCLDSCVSRPAKPLMHESYVSFMAAAYLKFKWRSRMEATP
jgi:hypothetical protein